MKDGLAFIVALLVATQVQADPMGDACVATSARRFFNAARHAVDSRYDLDQAPFTRIWPKAADGIWADHELAAIIAPKTDANRDHGAAAGVHLWGPADGGYIFSRSR